MVGLLLQHDANPHRRDRSGLTPLHLAAKFGHPSCVQLLLAAGSKVDTLDDTAGLNALEWAFESNQLASARMLAVHGAKLQQTKRCIEQALRWENKGLLILATELLKLQGNMTMLLFAFKALSELLVATSDEAKEDQLVLDAIHKTQDLLDSFESKPSALAKLRAKVRWQRDQAVSVGISQATWKFDLFLHNPDGSLRCLVGSLSLSNNLAEAQDSIGTPVKLPSIAKCLETLHQAVLSDGKVTYSLAKKTLSELLPSYEQAAIVQAAQQIADESLTPSWCQIRATVWRLFDFWRGGPEVEMKQAIQDAKRLFLLCDNRAKGKVVVSKLMSCFQDEQDECGHERAQVQLMRAEKRRLVCLSSSLHWVVPSLVKQHQHNRIGLPDFLTLIEKATLSRTLDFSV